MQFPPHYLYTMFRLAVRTARSARAAAAPLAGARTGMYAARTYSTAPQASRSSDKPWIIMSTVVFGGLLGYVLRPQDDVSTH